MAVIYVLIMVFSTGDSRGGVFILSQDFTSSERCEIAKTSLASSNLSAGYGSKIVAQGCFKK